MNRTGRTMAMLPVYANSGCYSRRQAHGLLVTAHHVINERVEGAVHSEFEFLLRGWSAGWRNGRRWSRMRSRRSRAPSGLYGGKGARFRAVKEPGRWEKGTGPETCSGLTHFAVIIIDSSKKTAKGAAAPLHAIRGSRRKMNASHEILGNSY